MGKIVREKLSGVIIGIAMDVLNELNPGLDEERLRSPSDQTSAVLHT